MVFASVTVDAPAHANYRLSWAQPITGPGDLANDWVLASTGVRVSRFRISDRVYLCSVRTNGAANAGLVTWDVVLGGASSNEVAYTGPIPNLAGCRLTITGQNNLPYTASIASTAVEVMRRESVGMRQVRRWTHTANAADIDTNGDPQKVHGVHTYLTYRDDTPCIVGAIRVTNASITVGSYGAGETTTGQFGIWNTYRSSAYGPIYTHGSTMVPPAGYLILWQRPLWTGLNNKHPTRMGYTRRFVLYPVATPVAEAQALLDLKGHGVVMGGTRNWWNTEAMGAHEALMPNLDLPGGYTGGYAGLRNTFAAMYATLLSRGNGGLYNPNADSQAPYDDFWRAPLGEFRPLGDWNALPPGVVGTAPHTGMQLVREYQLYTMLFHDYSMEGSGYWCIDKATGNPVTSKQFGQAAIGHGYPQNSGGLCPENGHVVGSFPNPAGRMPFHYNVQGYGNTNSSGIPGLCEVDPLNPSQTGQDPQPYAKPLSSGVCAFEHELYQWRPRFAGSHYCQHTAKAKAVIFLTGDLATIDDLEMAAENAAYAWSEVGALESTSYIPGNLQSLKDYVVQTAQSPGTASVWLGREAGWVCEAFALEYAFATDAQRALIKPRLQMFHDVFKNDVTADGMFGRQNWNGQQGIFIDSEAWTAPSDPNDPTHPAPAEVEVFSTDIQFTLFLHGLFAACRQLKGLGDPGFTIVRPLMMRGLNECLKVYAANGVTLRWTPSEYQTWMSDPLARSHGPAKYTASCAGPNVGQIPQPSDPLTFFDVTANPNVLDNKWYLGSGIGITYFGVPIEIAWRLSGSLPLLKRILQLGKSPNQWPTSTLDTLTQRALELLAGDSNPHTAGELQAGVAAYSLAFDATGYVPEDSFTPPATILIRPGVSALRTQVPAATVVISGITLTPGIAAVQVTAPSPTVVITAGTIVITPGTAGVRLQCPFQSATFASTPLTAEASASLDIQGALSVVSTFAGSLEGAFDVQAFLSVYPPASEGGDGNLQGRALAMLQALLPPGKAWTRGKDAVLTVFMNAFADEIAALERRAHELARELDPRTTSEMITDWERVTGLPDACAGPLVTIEQRRAAVVARLAQGGGQSPAFMKALAASLGFEVEIVEFRPFRAGRSRAGDRLTNPKQPFRAGFSRAGQGLNIDTGWRFTFGVRTNNTNPHYFRAGAGRAGEPLATWSNALLECAIKHAKPAHTFALFMYSLIIQVGESKVTVMPIAPNLPMSLTILPDRTAVIVRAPAITRV